MMKMIERKIIITNCRECPFCDWSGETTYAYGHWKCIKYGFRVKRKTYANADIEASCMLPVNIKSNSFQDDV